MYATVCTYNHAALAGVSTALSRLLNQVPINNTHSLYMYVYVYGIPSLTEVRNKPTTSHEETKRVCCLLVLNLVSSNTSAEQADNKP
jgi:hypothetical protein